MTLRATSSILNVPVLCFTCIGEQTVSLVGVGDMTVWIGLRAGRASSRLLGLNNSLSGATANMLGEGGHHFGGGYKQEG